MRELARRHSNQRAQAGLGELLTRYGISGIGGIDTRRLTRLLRDTGAMAGAFGTATEAELRTAATAEPGTDGIDLVAEVTTEAIYTVHDGLRGQRGRTIVAYDFGIKHTILRQLARLGTVHVVPASTPAADVLAMSPDGVFLSNGPGDPAEVPYASAAIGGLIGNVPVFGICLGHQLLGRALGGETFKLPFGHHGGNHPVQQLSSGHVEITSQNHNFAVVRRFARRRRRRHPRQPQRRHERGHAGPRRPGLQRAVPPRGRARPARQPLPVRRVRRADGRSTAEQAAARPGAPARHARADVRADERERLMPKRTDLHTRS